MIFSKNNKLYSVKEYNNKWVIEFQSGKLSVAYDVSKDICKTEADVEKYIMNNDLF